MSRSRNTAKVGTINPNTIRVRDPLMVALIRGVTKSGVAVDRRREASRKACRGRVNPE
jgi:hypothetical protein